MDDGLLGRSVFGVTMRGMSILGGARGFAPVGLLPVNRMRLPVMRRSVVLTGALILPGRPVVERLCRDLPPPVAPEGLLCCRGVGVFSPSSRSISRHTSLDFSQ